MVFSPSVPAAGKFHDRRGGVSGGPPIGSSCPQHKSGGHRVRCRERVTAVYSPIEPDQLVTILGPQSLRRFAHVSRWDQCERCQQVMSAGQELPNSPMRQHHCLHFTRRTPGPGRHGILTDCQKEAASSSKTVLSSLPFFFLCPPFSSPLFSGLPPLAPLSSFHLEKRVDDLLQLV